MKFLFVFIMFVWISGNWILIEFEFLLLSGIGLRFRFGVLSFFVF